ncbi:MAG: hypothetical protein E5Y79_31540 [Mesorhizobium sp.]|nr:MAG: hypothetical protein E5Y79_31540 [Mesorhizobium sp.]
MERPKSISEMIERYDSDFYEPIGRLIMQFGFLEFDIDHWLSALGADQPKLRKANNLNNKITLYGQIIDQHTTEPNDLAERDRLVQQMRELNTFRNRVVHGPWSAYLVEKKAWQKLSVNRQNATHQFFEVTADVIRAAASDLAKIQVDASHFAFGFLVPKKA